MSQSNITPEILQAIDILEALETLLEKAPTPEVEAILQEAWIKVSETFPEDFKEATREDAGAERLRRYIRVKAFFENPTENPISPQELEAYSRNREPVDEDAAEFFFP
jgi:HSP90 family molecular chaperone